jgi:hypothetical protein
MLFFGFWNASGAFVRCKIAYKNGQELFYMILYVFFSGLQKVISRISIQAVWRIRITDPHPGSL